MKAIPLLLPARDERKFPDDEWKIGDFESADEAYSKMARLFRSWHSDAVAPMHQNWNVVIPTESYTDHIWGTRIGNNFQDEVRTLIEYVRSRVEYTPSRDEIRIPGEYKFAKASNLAGAQVIYSGIESYEPASMRHTIENLKDSEQTEKSDYIEEAITFGDTRAFVLLAWLFTDGGKSVGEIFSEFKADGSFVTTFSRLVILRTIAYRNDEFITTSRGEDVLRHFGILEIQ